MNNGFYGSLSKIQKINFQFDRIFPNRAAMDQEAELGYYIAEGSNEKLPPVFNGRYVLVDYHEGEVVDKTVRIGYKYIENGETVIGAAPGIPFGSSEGVAVENGDRITVLGEYDANEEYTPYTVPKLYEYPNFNTEIVYTSGNNANVDMSTYEKNLVVDGQQYGNIGRGWDSTVWQKTYQNGKVAYVMIAELNAFSPTLAIGADAPTEIPANPYFGTDSTLDFYRIHMQSPAGIRVKAAEELKFREENNLNILVPESSVNPTPPPGSKGFSTDLKHYPSDVNGNVAYFNGEESDTLGNLPLAIYFNKDGMNKHVSKSDVGEDDAIQFNYTGRSGKKYFKEHVEAGDPSTDFAVDTYELSIMLPSLGESISRVYDLAYGGNRWYNSDGLHLYWNNPLESPGEGADFSSVYFTYENPNNTDNLPRDRQFRNTDIYWNSKQGIRLFKKEKGQRVFDQDGLNSLAGMINTAHDLMGMIIRDYDDLSLNDVRAWDPTKIYFVNNRYYYKTKKYTWTAYADQQAIPKPSSEAYNQIHFLPSNLVRQIVDPEDPNNVEIALTTDLDSSLIYFIDTAHNGAGHSQNVIYRESWEEYPTITDAETFDSNNLLFRTKYINYIKVKDEDDLIDGAVYGIIAENNSADSQQDEPESGHVYYYYDVTNSTPGVYQKETGNFNKGVYYDLTNLNSYQINKEFYIPNVFYVYNKTTGKTSLATESSLSFYTGSHSYASNNGNYVFYRRVMSGSGTPVEEVLDAYEWKRQTVPVDRYVYENGTLIIYQDSSKSASIESITFIAADDSNNKNGIDNIEFDLNDNPIYYWTMQYTNSNKIDYYTKEELFQYGLDSTEWNIPKHLIREASGNATGNIIIPDTNSLISSLVDFEEGKYFYIYSGGNTLVLENFNRLRTSEGRVRSETHAYYEINLPGLKKVFQTAGGSYYKTAEGDYKLYPAPNMRDPYESVLTSNGKPLQGETKQIGRPIFIPLGNIDKFRIFKPNMYYTSLGGSLATEFVIDNQHQYYERVGNIFGNSEPTYADGLEWNQPEKPASGTLGQYVLDWEAKEIKGLGEETNTMFGLILKINRLLEGENKNTRDSSSVQGIINQCKDTLAMMKTFGFAFNSFQVEDNEGTAIGNELVANTAGDKVKLISNNSLINLNVNTADKQIRFDETILNAETDDVNDITYLNVGDVSAQVENPQIIEYPKNVNANTYYEENIENLLVNNRDTDLAFNANDIAFYGPNEELTRTEIKYFEPTQWTNPDPNDNTQWTFSTIGNSLTVNSSNLNFVLSLLSDISSNRRTDFVNYSKDWTNTMVLQGTDPDDLSSYTFSQANLDVTLDSNNANQANIAFSLELNAPLTDLPENGITHTVKLIIYDSNNNNNIYYQTTKNINFINNSVIFAIQGFSVNLNQLQNGKVSFILDNNSAYLTDNNDPSSQYNTETDFTVWNSSFIEIPGNNHVLALTDGEDITYYQRNDFNFGRPGVSYTIGGSENNPISFTSNPDGKNVILSIDGVAIQTWNNFSMPTTPTPVKIGEFKSTGQLNLYKGLSISGSNRPVYNNRPLVTSSLAYPIHVEWIPRVPGIPADTTYRETFSQTIMGPVEYLGKIGPAAGAGAGTRVTINEASLIINPNGDFNLKLDVERLNTHSEDNIPMCFYLGNDPNDSNNQIYYTTTFNITQAASASGYSGQIADLSQLTNNVTFKVRFKYEDMFTITYNGLQTTTTEVDAIPAQFIIYSGNTPLIKIQEEQED